LAERRGASRDNHNSLHRVLSIRGYQTAGPNGGPTLTSSARFLAGKRWGFLTQRGSSGGGYTGLIPGRRPRWRINMAGAAGWPSPTAGTFPPTATPTASPRCHLPGGQARPWRAPASPYPINPMCATALRQNRTHLLCVRLESGPQWGREWPDVKTAWTCHRKCGAKTRAQMPYRFLG